MNLRWWAGTCCLAGACLAAALGAWRMDWVSDDAFVSFRCARNLARGLGLTFNAEEPVESYTNFLWTVLLAGAAKAGIELESFARVAGLACFLLTGLALAVVERRFTPAGAWWLPVAACAWLLGPHAQAFAVSGLETAFFVLWVTLALLALVQSSTLRGTALAGLFASLATLTRPDGVLVLVLAIAVVAGTAAPPTRRSELLALLAAPCLLIVPWLAWKLRTYGGIVPNTFYAKVGYEPYASQGLRYLGLYFGCYYGLIGALVAGALLFARRRAEGWQTPGWSGNRAVFVLGGFSALYLGFVLWVGGDFMFARFGLPFTPALLLLASLGIAGLRSALRVTAAVALAASFVFPRVPAALARGEFVAGIAEERLFNSRERIEAMRKLGPALEERTRGTGVRMLVGGGMMSLAYYADFPFVIDTYGLTDPGVARRPLVERGRIGHEKELLVFAPYYALRRIDLALPLGGVLPRLEGDPFAAVRWLRFEGAGPAGDALPALVLCYRREVMDALARRGARVPDIDAWLDDYIASLPQRPPERVRAELPALQAFYFAHNSDPARLEAIEARLAADAGR